MTTTWIDQAKQKIASSVPQDEKAITEAFAQQAYTVIGNRDREIMRDPYMLGFEIVSKNEENTRLVGVFAFRVSGEILLAPVFYLNGQIKGQDLLYRKGVNRFVPNTDKWISYLLARGDEAEGRPIQRQALDSRIHLDLGQLSGRNLLKGASDESVDIKQLWKEAMEAWSVTAPEHLFAQMIVDQGMQKEAAWLAEKLPAFAELIHLANSLEQKVQIKQAAEPKPALTLYLEPQPGWSEDRIEAFYKQGYALEDPRDMKGLSDAYEDSPMSKSVTTLNEPGEQTIQNLAGDEAKVLWAPVVSIDSYAPVGSCGGRMTGNGEAYGLLYLDGKDKGCWLYYPEYGNPSDLPVFKDGATLEDDAEKMGDTVCSCDVKGETPKAGKMYAVWLPSLKKMIKPFPVRSVEKSGEVTKINFKGDSGCSAGCRLVINKNLETSTEEDLRGAERVPAVCGADAVFIPVEASLEYQHGQSNTPENISWGNPTAPANILPVTVGRVDECMLKTKTAAVTLIPVGRGRTDIMVNGKRKAEDLEAPMVAFKLAGALGLPAALAVEYAARGSREQTKFHVLRAREKQKLAQVYYDSAHVELLKQATDFDALMEKEAFRVPFQSSLIRRLGDASLLAGTGISGYSAMDQISKNPEGDIKGTTYIPAALGMLMRGRGPAASAALGTLGITGGAMAQIAGNDIGSNNVKSPPEDEAVTENSESHAVEGDSDNGLMQQIQEYLKNPYVLGGLAAGIPAAVYGTHRYLEGKNSKRRKEESETGEYSEEAGTGWEPDKKASAYYDREIDPYTDFQDTDYDEDLNVPVHHPEDNYAIAQMVRQQQVSPQRRYLDAGGNSGPRNKPYTHIPDEIIMNMADPLQEMAQIGEQMGLQSLMDHGAVGSLTKVFDATPFIQEYVDKLEGSLDYMARLLFMLYWKPKDFAKTFGTDDLPNLENKLTGVFLSYGDLVLELRQTSEDPR